MSSRESKKNYWFINKSYSAAIVIEAYSEEEAETVLSQVAAEPDNYRLDTVIDEDGNNLLEDEEIL